MDKSMQEHIKIEAKGDAMAIWHGNLPEVFQYKGFNYRTTSARGFVDLIKARANKDRCVIFWTGIGAMRAIMDDSIIDRPQDNVEFIPAETIQYKEWAAALTGAMTMDQKAFIDFLQARQSADLPERDSLLAKVKSFSYVTRTKGDAMVDDNNNYSFAINVNNVEGTVQVPASLELRIPLFEETDCVHSMELNLEVNIPREKGDTLSFTLKCPTFERCRKEAVDSIVAFVRDELDGYLMVRA